MVKIKKLTDLGKLKESEHAHIFVYIRKLFLHLHKCLEPQQPVHLFDLSELGYIVVLESGDDIRNLKEIGLSPEENGLLGAVPEAVTAKKLDDGQEFFQIELIFNNEYMMYLLLFPEDFDKEIQEWIQTYSEEVVFT